MDMEACDLPRTNKLHLRPNKAVKGGLPLLFLTHVLYFLGLLPRSTCEFTVSLSPDCAERVVIGSRCLKVERHRRSPMNHPACTVSSVC